MFDPNDIVTHLQAHMPAFSSLFHSETTASATVAGNTITFTATGHGLAVGDMVIVAGGQTRNTISAGVINTDGTTTFETAQDHDQTAPQQVNDQKTLTLEGFTETAWNGIFDIEDVDNRRTFTIMTPTGQTTLPTFGSGVLVENNSFLLGIQTITTVPDANTFTVTLPGPVLPTGSLRGLRLVTSAPRIFGAADISIALSSYSESSSNQIEPTLFVIIDDTDVSKDRHTLNDGLASFDAANLQKQTLLQNFSVVAVLPAYAQTRGFQASQQAHTHIFRALLSCLYGFRFEDPVTQQSYTTVSAGHGPGQFNSAYYTHVYEWQVPFVITFETGENFEPDVAFRDIDLSMRLNSDDIALLTANIDLDKQPL